MHFGGVAWEQQLPGPCIWRIADSQTAVYSFRADRASGLISPQLMQICPRIWRR